MIWIKTMRVLHEVLKKEFNRLGVGEVKSPIFREGDEWPIVRDASHHMGTTRMGNNCETSVVDKNCKVHGVDNLFIAGSSVFATGGHANPTATLVALTIRLCDYLKSRL